jgi:hypothetical protein
MSVRKITVDYPENIFDSNELKYFEGKNVVTLTKEKVRKLNNVFVSHEGLCVKDGVFLTSSAFNMFGNEDNTVFYQFCKLATEQYFVTKFGKSIPLQKLEGDYLLVHSKWFNFYFWLTSSLYRLILTENSHKEVTLILPEYLSKFKFVQDTLLMFPNLKAQIISPGVQMKVTGLLFPEVRKWSVSISPETIKAIKTKVLEYAFSNRTLPNGVGSKIFVTRKKTGKRDITNGIEVERLLKKRGFSTISFEDYDLYEQALIMTQATHVVGLHGAGFANILYMNAKSALFELMAYPPTLKDHRTGFWRLSRVIGLRYFVQFCVFDVDPNQKLFIDNNYVVDMKKFNKNLELFLSK